MDRMAEKERKKPHVSTAYDLMGRSIAADVMRSPAYEAISRAIIKSSGVQDALDRLLQPYGGVLSSQVNNLVAVKPVDFFWVRDTHMKPRIDFASSLTAPLGLDVLGLNGCTTGFSDTLRHSIVKAAGIDRVFQGLMPTVRFGIDDVLLNPFRSIVRPLSPQLPGLAEKLADILLPPNLQGFSETEWAQLIDMVTEDGIGLIWAPSNRHLRALLSLPDRKSRYAYLHEQREDLFDEVADGLRQVGQEELQDLADLGLRAVDAARAGLWEAGLSLATDVCYTAMETKALDWYRDEFKAARDSGGQRIGERGPGKAVTFIINNVPLPPKWVGIFELRAHLVIRPLSETFAQSDTVHGKHNRHAICHTASRASIREEYLVPALLNMHSLLRGLDEKMTDDEMEGDEEE
ncbi:hypothetical protein GCM10018773_65910 [Streptomyces candidus]|nr:hypothetical protein GCM10018773_65910 [Streptomyces candidus]